jgi:putative hemolysin
MTPALGRRGQADAQERSVDRRSFARPALPAWSEGRYWVRFAQDERDLEEVQRLRFEVFNVELGEGLEDSWKSGRDADAFDPCCDHLMVHEATSQALVGTYRLQTRAMAERGAGFYCAGEFDLAALGGEILQQGIELGRACVVAGQRDALALYALWRGLVGYARWHEKRYFFGCCSLTSQDESLARRMQRHLGASGACHPELCVPALRELACGTARPADGGPVKVPKLFDTYLRFGCKVVSEPAIDRAFKTIDFLVLMDLRSIPARAREFFGAGLPRSEA